MTHPDNTISEADLHAYVDEQLTPERRIAVEAHLARHPNLAARVMADLRGRDELRLAMNGRLPVVKLTTQDAARRLERGLARDALFVRIRRAGAIAALIAIGWFAHVEFLAIGSRSGGTSATLPSYVDDAARAHRTALLRASMQSQPVSPVFDAEEIRSATAITVPELPREWQIVDVQIFPSSAGPAVEMAIRDEKLGALSLFAVRPGRFDVMPTAVTSSDDVTAAYWQIGDIAYALVGNAGGEEMNEAAAKIASTLY